MALDKLVDSTQLDGALSFTADAIREKTGEVAPITWDMDTGFAQAIEGITGGIDTSDADATSSDILDGKTAYVNGEKVEGNIPTKTGSNLSASGKTVTVPAGYYAQQYTKDVATGSASTPATTVTANPSISVNSSGLITATASATKSVTPTVSAGYVSSGTAGAITVSGSNTSQLSTQSGVTITPTESEQTAVASGKYTTGAVKVGAISSTYVGSDIPQNDSDDLTASGATVTAPAGYYAEDATKAIANGTVVASVSSNTGGSASMSASGFTASSSSTSYYVNLSTTPGSVKAKATGGTAGYVTSSTTNETSATSVAVSGNNTKLYIPTTGVKASVSSNTGGSASMSATGISPLSSGTSNYYVTLSTTAGSVKAKAVGNGTGIITSGISNETSATSVAVSGNNTKMYIPEATFANSATSGTTYTDKSSTGPVLVAGDYLYINKGYTPDIKISLAKLVPDGSDVKGHGEYIISGHSAYDNDGTLVAGTIPTLVSSDLTVNGKTVTVPLGKYTGESGGTAVSTSIGVGNVTSGTASITSLTRTYNSTNGNFDITGSANVSAPTVNTAGYISSSEGTKSAKTGGATVTATVAKIVGSTAITGTTTKKPSIAKVATPTGVTNAASGDATTTAPSSGVYVAVKSNANTGTLTATPSVTTAGYGDATNHGIAANTATVGAQASDTTYVPITTTSASVSGKTVSYGTGWITGGSKSVADGTVVASVSSNTGGSASMSATGFTASTNATDYYVTLATSAGSVKAKAAGGTAGYVTSSTTNETSVTSVSVSGNGTKMYIPAGGYSGSVSSHSITTTPVVTGALSGTGTNIGTTTKPSGTDGTDYWAFTPGGSVTTTGVSTAKGKATISTAGYIPTGNNESGAHTVNITPTASNGTTRYITKATSSSSSGTASATAGTASASVTGMVTTTTNTGYSVSASATGGNASVTASSVTVGAGYNPSSVTASTTAKSATGTSASETKYIQKGVLSASVSSNSGGSASMVATGFTAASSATDYYVTLSTSAGSVKAKASVGTEGYVKTETNETAATSVAVSGNGNKLYVPAGGVTTSLSADGMGTYFNAGTSSDKNVTLTPKYTNTAGYIAAHSTATNNGGTAYYKIKTTSASVSGGTVSYGTGWITEGSKTVSSGTITNNTTLPSGSTSSGTVNRGSYIKIGAGYYGSDAYYYAQNVSNGTITNNTTLPSGSSSSGTVNRGSYIKIGAGYYSADKYYYAQTNSGTKTITGSGETDVNGYAKASVAAVSGSIGGSASGGSATAAISNVNSMNTISDVSGKTAGTDYWAVKATATGSAGSYTPKYTVSTAGWIGSTVTGTAQSVSVSSDSTGKSIYIPKATFDKSGATVYCKTAGYIPAGSASSGVGTIGNGTVVASVSSNSGGSASMAATGFTASSSATNYYVTLTTSAGSVKAKAVGGTSGYVTSSTTNETAATSVAVSGNNTKLYIPAGSVTNNTSGGTSSGTINMGSQIKIGAGYYPSNLYYTAKDRVFTYDSTNKKLTIAY